MHDALGVRVDGGETDTPPRIVGMTRAGLRSDFIGQFKVNVPLLTHSTL